VYGIAERHQAQLAWYALDYQRADVRTIAAYYAVKSHPVTLLIDATGQVRLRVNGIPDATTIEQAVSRLISVP
jgi:hypothetical protein